MKALALVTDNLEQPNKWLFDRILAMIAYDIDVSVVFVNDGCLQLLENKMWNALPIYGVDKIFDFDDSKKIQNHLLSSHSISLDELRTMVSLANIFL